MAPFFGIPKIVVSDSNAYYLRHVMGRVSINALTKGRKFDMIFRLRLEETAQ